MNTDDGRNKKFYCKFGWTKAKKGVPGVRFSGGRSGENGLNVSLAFSLSAVQKVAMKTWFA